MKPVRYQEGIVVTATEFKQNFGKYLSCIEEQKDVVITKNGKKVARLTPYLTDIEQYFTVSENTLDYICGGKKVSYEEFIEISEKSTLRMELINGEINLLASPSISHQEILGKIYIAFNEYFREKDCKVFMAPFDVHFKKKDIKEPDVMQPDLLVVCDLKGNISEKDKYMGTPTLVIEILSDRTRSKDMVDKLNTYMLSGVREYWMIDFKNLQMLIYNFTNFNIDNFRSFKQEDMAVSAVFEGLSLDTGEVFKT